MTRFEAEQIKVWAELSVYSKKTWDILDEQYYISYDYYTGSIFYGCEKFRKYGTLHFPSAEAAIKAVEAVGEERVKMYYLNVGSF